MPAVTVNREKLIQVLNGCRAGLATESYYEQSDCFVADEGRLRTYNEEVSCSVPSPFGELTGAIRAVELLEILPKLKDDDIEVTFEDDKLIFKGGSKGRRKTTIVRQKDILLPIQAVDEPGEWKPLHEDFLDAIRTVQGCAANDISDFSSTCIHLHPEWVEAANTFQICRWPMETGLIRDVLVRQKAIKNIVHLDVTEFCETEHWLHFRSPKDYILSCRRYEETEEYLDCTPHLKVEKSEPIVFPKNTIEVLDRAKVFLSSEEGDQTDSFVLVEVRPKKMRIVGSGKGGSHEEILETAYSGKKTSFYIAPDILRDVVNRYSDCFLGKKKLMVSGGGYTYVTWLMQGEK